MLLHVEVMVLLAVVWVGSSGSQLHANVIMKNHLCTLPQFNESHMECEPATAIKPEKLRDRFKPGDCNQARCKCSYSAQKFTQSCVYNKTFPFTRTCSDFRRDCTLYNDVNDAVCEESYGKCEIVSAPLKSRLAVGYPQSNPPICYPGFQAGRNGCNATTTGCKGRVKSAFTSTTDQTLKSCSATCGVETVSCTNFTKTCNDTFTKWHDRYKSAVSTTRGKCDVITKKCREHRRFKLIPLSAKAKSNMNKHKPQSDMESVLIKTYNCSITSNLTYSKEFCVDYIMSNMEYKVECQSYGVTFAEYLIDSFYRSTDVSVSSVTSYLTSQWDVIKKMCKDDCFTAVTREMRNCVADLPIQSVLPGITHTQLRFLMYHSADLLCASVSDKKTDESCLEYADPNSELSKQVLGNMSAACKTEIKQMKEGSAVTCLPKCKDHLIAIATERDRDPGCCLEDLMRFKRGTAQWMEMMSPDLFNNNTLIQLVEHCAVEKLRSCTETDGMHPAVIFVLAVIGIFSVLILSGVIVFIVVFYQQMEYEGYKKGFIHNLIIS